MANDIDMVTFGHETSSNHKCFCVQCLNYFLFDSFIFNLFLCKQNLIFVFCIIGLTTTCSMFYLLGEVKYGLLGYVFYGGYDVF